MPLEWITDRLPTEADADGDGLVRVPQCPYPHQDGRRWQDYSRIAPGQPWWSRMVPERVEVEPASAPAPAPALSFAVGQQWRNRNGQVVTIAKIDPRADTAIPILADNGFWYRADGTSCINHSEDDLIELVSGPEPTPCLKSLTDDQLHVHFVAVQAETMRRLAARYIVEAKRPGGLLA